MYGRQLRQYGLYPALARYFFLAGSKENQVVRLCGAAKLQEHLQQADHARAGVVTSQTVDLAVLLHCVERGFPPSVYGLHSVDVRVQQQCRLLQVEHRAQAPYIVALSSGGHSLHLDVVLQEVGGLLFFAAQGRNGYQ